MKGGICREKPTEKNHVSSVPQTATEHFSTFQLIVLLVQPTTSLLHFALNHPPLFQAQQVVCLSKEKKNWDESTVNYLQNKTADNVIDYLVADSGAFSSLRAGYLHQE